jgi:hypothetical protein
MDGTPELEVKIEFHPHMVVPGGTEAEDVELSFPNKLDDASSVAKEADEIVEQGGIVDLDAHDLRSLGLIIELWTRARPPRLE